MEQCLYWLQEYKSHQHDEYWLDQHGDEIYTIIRQRLTSPPKFEYATELLISAFPYYALHRLDIDRWVNLLIEALLVAQELGDTTLRTQLMEQIGTGRMAEGHIDTAHFAYLYVMEHAHDSADMELELAAHTGLIWLQTLSHAKPPIHNDAIIENALALAQNVKDTSAVARLHHALAAVYVQQHCTEKALQYGQMAYAHWYTTRNRVEQAKAAYSLASVYRLMNRYALADAYLAIAEDVFSRTNYRRQYVLTIYERGVLRWKHARYEEAIQWLELALKEAQMLGTNYHIAATTHALGSVYLKMGQEDKARELLKSAALIWDKLSKAYEQASICCNFICMERRSGNFQAAQEWSARAWRLCELITPASLRREMENYIREAESDHSQAC